MAELVGQACSPLLDKAACPLWLTLLSPPVPSPGMALPSFHTSGWVIHWSRWDEKHTDVGCLVEWPFPASPQELSELRGEGREEEEGRGGPQCGGGPPRDSGAQPVPVCPPPKLKLASLVIFYVAGAGLSSFGSLPSAGLSKSAETAG